MITRWDKFIIGFVLFLALVCYCVFSFLVFGQQAEGVEVFVDGKEYASYNFSEIDGRKVLYIDTETGSNTLEITRDGAKMTDASCPDKVDVQSGKITEPGQMIICVPNKVYVRIFGKDRSNIDMVTY